ncbi:cellulase-domain-containing protein [Piromyces finnis]|uniref:Cellulase-domain-containing protein n=1 Tax=Piromyces finnis TaxID=1754191 RepID=A0A1Y1VFU5_9FUNG|nr:cellulase-domain-containing protein [Piromyces finnis]|eukprot:ORX54908.1 cellulase-domain-containing protein [Piromyces finnis]
MKILNIFFLVGITIISSYAMKDIPSKELVKNLKVGWSLGNTLDAHCLENLDYSEDQLASETCWGNVKTTPELYSKLNELGFNVFRIPTTWTGHFGEAPEYKINEEWMKRVHEVVDYAINTGSYAILNVHHENWNYAFSDNVENAKIIINALWTQIANEFIDYDEHLIFEGLNEPRKVGTDVEWNGGDKEGWDAVNEMNAEFIKTVRATGSNNSLRHLMIPTYAATVNGGAITNFLFPSDDNKLIVSLHAYTPYNFALNTGEGATDKFENTKEIDSLMNTINTSFIKKDIPVILGEFGAMNRDNESERARWIKYYVKQAAALGIPCVLWDNGLFEGEGELFGIIDRSSLEVVYPVLLKGLMLGLEEANTDISSKDEQNINYNSCKTNDFLCKAKMAEKCYDEVFKCWLDKKKANVCRKLNETCGKIWISNNKI